MKKFFKILRKIIKILLKIILRLILGIIVLTGIILFIINNRTLKFYEDDDWNTKFTMKKSFIVENGHELILDLNGGIIIENEIYNGDVYNKGIIKINLKKGIITFDGINLEDLEIPGGYLESHSTIKLKKLNFKDVKQGYKNGDIENFFDILKYFIYGEEIKYHDNGQIFNKIIYVNWMENGPYISYYNNGQIEEEGNYINGNKDGYRVEYFDDGNIYNEGNYINGLENGIFTGYFEDGNIKFIYNFKNGKYDGNSVYYGDNGLFTDIKADNGIGTITVYNKNNDVITEYGFITDELNNTILNGKYIKHFDDGKISELNYKNGKYDGNQIGYYSDNSIRFSGNFENGLGIMYYYDENGNIIGTGEIEFSNQFVYRYGYYSTIKNGLNISLYDNGKIKEISNYTDGILNGVQKVYYENGNPRYMGENIKEKMLYGYDNLNKFEYYDKDGNLIGTGGEFCSQRSGDICIDIQKMGNVVISQQRNPSGDIEIYENIDGFKIIQNKISWYENGNLEYIQNFKDGNLDGEIITYYKDEQIKTKGNYKDGKINGEFISYYENGQLWLKGNYINGEPDGYRVQYFENGDIYGEGNYDNGKRIGVWNRYLGDGSIGFSKDYGGIEEIDDK